jgi:hypothetical protein
MPMLRKRLTMTALMKLVISGLAFVSLIAGPVRLSAQDSAAPPLSIQDVLQLHNSGFSDDVIITRIKKNAKAFDLSTPELVELKKAGLSDVVVRYLLDPSQPWSPPAPQSPQAAKEAVPPQPARHFPKDEYAAVIPPDPGLYRIANGNPVRMDLKVLLAAGGGGLGMLKKSKVLGYLVGPESQTRLTDPSPHFYLRLALGKAIEEIVLVSLEQKADRRELEAASTGAKPEFRPDTISLFEAVEVGPALFRVIPAKLESGEYMFLQIGSAEPAKGISGKGFDFGVEERKAAGKQETVAPPGE